MLQTDPVGQSLLLLIAAAAIMFLGVRALWAGSPGAGLVRGMFLALPVIAIALLFTLSGSAGTGIALLLACSVFMMTLGVGVAAANVHPGGGVGSPLLRLLAPLCLITCLVGFHGELSLVHAGVLLITGILVAWTAAEGRPRILARSRTAWLAAAVPALAAGIFLMLIAVEKFQSAAGANVVTPVVVLMVGPASLIALLGVMGRQEETGEAATDTAVGFLIACLGFGQAIIIALANALERFSHAATKTAPAVLMPVASWRVDSVLLVVLSILFFPIGTRRFKLGRLEGLALVVLYLLYARVAVRTGSLTG